MTTFAVSPRKAPSAQRAIARNDLHLARHQRERLSRAMLALAQLRPQMRGRGRGSRRTVACSCCPRLFVSDVERAREREHEVDGGLDAAATRGLNPILPSPPSSVPKLSGSQPTTVMRAVAPIARAVASAVNGSRSCPASGAPISAGGSSASMTYSVPGAPPRDTVSIKMASPVSPTSAYARSIARMPKSRTPTPCGSVLPARRRATSDPKASSPRKMLPMPATSISFTRPRRAPNPRARRKSDARARPRGPGRGRDRRRASRRRECDPRGRIRSPRPSRACPRAQDP